MSSKDKLTKQDLKGPDAFVSASDHLFRWIEDHARSIATILLLVAVASLGWVAYGYYSESQERHAAEALFKPETELRDIEAKLRESRAAKMQNLAAGKDKNDKKAKVEDLNSPADYEKDFAPAVGKITTAIRAHANTKAAMISALNLASFLVQQKQFAPALQVLEVAKFQPSKNDLLAGFWRMHRGLVYLENQKADEAIKEYKEILDSSSLKSFHPEAWLKTGVAYELKGDTDKARETYEKVDREFRGTEASNAAAQYLRLLELKQQQG